VVGAASRTLTCRAFCRTGEEVCQQWPCGRAESGSADLYKIAAKSATMPIKVSGWRPVPSTSRGTHPTSRSYYIRDAKRITQLAVAPIFNARLKEIVAAGAK